jgi:hypothetical protein
MTAQKIKDVLIEKLDNIDQLAFGNYDQSKLGLGDIEEVAQHGGEGEGEDWYSVMYFKDHDVYLKCQGSYSSYNGTEFYGEWDDCIEVRPQEVTITVYK